MFHDFSQCHACTLLYIPSEDYESERIPFCFNRLQSSETLDNLERHSSDLYFIYSESFPHSRIIQPSRDSPSSVHVKTRRSSCSRTFLQKSMLCFLLPLKGHPNSLITQCHTRRALFRCYRPIFILILYECNGLPRRHSTHFLESREATEDGGERIRPVVFGKVPQEEDLVWR